MPHFGQGIGADARRIEHATIHRVRQPESTTSVAERPLQVALRRPDAEIRRLHGANLVRLEELGVHARQRHVVVGAVVDHEVAGDLGTERDELRRVRPEQNPIGPEPTERPAYLGCEESFVQHDAEVRVLKRNRRRGQAPDPGLH